MKKNLLSVGVILLSISAHAQLTFVGNSAVVTVTPNTLVYNGGGFKVDNTGKVDNGGNIMLVAANSTDKFETVAASGTFNLKDNNAVGTFTPPSYGQLYISGFTQGNLTGIVNKEYQAPSNGSYQQIALPFFQKTFSTLGTSTGDFPSKTLSNARYSQNEILKYDNANVVSLNVNISSQTSDPTAYYMLGGKNLNVETVINSVKGRPLVDGISVPIVDAGKTPNFGTGGLGRNQYGEKYNTYLGDSWYQGTAWTGDYGRNIYQYGNPYFTNLDLSNIYQNTPSPNGDGNYLPNIQGIRVDGTYLYTSITGTAAVTQQYVTFSTGNPRIPTSDVNALIIKPMQTFVIKLFDDSLPANTKLNFDQLRRFKYVARDVSKVNTVTADKMNRSSTVKQLGVIALNSDGNELGRTYFVIYDNGISGHTTSLTTQVSGDQSNVIGTFEENPTTGGIDSNYASQYWLYTNEANEKDFTGKPLPMSIYGSDVKSLKFEVRENADLIASGVHNLSTGIGFYYEASNGKVEEVSQNQTIPVTAAQYSLFYGQPQGTLATDGVATKTSRTQVAFNPSIDNYIIRFDSEWKTADIQVYDLSGKLVLSKKNVSTGSDFVIPLVKHDRGYIVTATSEKGVKATAKIIR